MAPCLGKVAKGLHCHRPCLFCLHTCIAASLWNYFERIGSLILISLQLHVLFLNHLLFSVPTFYLLVFMLMSFLNDQFFLFYNLFRKAISLPYAKSKLCFLDISVWWTSLNPSPVIFRAFRVGGSIEGIWRGRGTFLSCLLNNNVHHRSIPQSSVRPSPTQL